MTVHARFLITMKIFLLDYTFASFNVAIKVTNFVESSSQLGVNLMTDHNIACLSFFFFMILIFNGP